MTTTAEMNAVTREHFMLDGGKAFDIYYNTSARIERKLKKKKGLHQSASGTKIKVPLAFNEGIGGSFSRGGSLDSNYRELITSVEFEPVSIYGNGTIYGQDEIMNQGSEGMVKLIRAQADAAAKKPFLVLARTVYGTAGDGDEDVMGIQTICTETTTTDVGGKAEDDIVDANGVKAWEGKTVSDSTVMSTVNVRAAILRATYKDGPDGYPTHCYLTRTLYNSFKDQVQTFTTLGEDKELTKIGFHNIVFDGVTFIADDFLDSGHLLIENDRNLGFAVYPKANMAIGKWEDTQIAGVWAKTMKVFWMGNQIVNDRRAHCLYTAMTT